MSWNNFWGLLNCSVTFSRFAKYLKLKHHSSVFNVYHEVPLNFQILSSELSYYFHEGGFPDCSLLAEWKQIKLGKSSASWNMPWDNQQGHSVTCFELRILSLNGCKFVKMTFRIRGSETMLGEEPCNRCCELSSIETRIKQCMSQCLCCIICS